MKLKIKVKGIKEEKEGIRKEIKKVEKFGYKHHNLILLFVSIIVAYYLLKSEYLKSAILKLGSLNYFGALVAGVFYTYGLTTIPASALIYLLGKTLNPIIVSFIGAFGSMTSDFLIFAYVKYGLVTEIKMLASELHLKIPKILRSKFFYKIAPLIGGLIIASPLPDEIGAALIGMTEYKTKNFLLCSYFLNFIGILLIACFGKVV
ncbi:MAG: hypothetical protein ACP5JY_00875 [Candidatus Nanoarchaeia archaeon]